MWDKCENDNFFLSHYFCFTATDAKLGFQNLLIECCGGTDNGNAGSDILVENDLGHVESIEATDCLKHLPSLRHQEAGSINLEPDNESSSSITGSSLQCSSGYVSQDLGLIVGPGEESVENYQQQPNMQGASQFHLGNHLICSVAASNHLQQRFYSPRQQSDQVHKRKPMNNTLKSIFLWFIYGTFQKLPIQFLDLILGRENVQDVFWY